MFMYLFNYSLLIIVMVMPCGVIGYIMFKFYFLCKTVVTIKINKFMYLSYIVSISNVNGTMFINNNIISKLIT